MNNPLYSFNTPCRRWKIVVAYKGQNGIPGFIAPFFTRYLNMTQTITVDSSHLTDPLTGLPVDNGIQVFQAQYAFDRILGALTLNTGPGEFQSFPYGIDIAASMAANTGEVWEVSDTHFKHTVVNPIGYNPAPLQGDILYTTEVTLSNEYTLAQLDADADALIAQVDITKMPWDTAQFNSYGEFDLPIGPYTPIGQLPVMLPTGIINFPIGAGVGIETVPQLSGVAWAILSPGSVSAGNTFPNGYLKAVAHVAMAGNYCRKTYLIDWNQAPLNQTCLSGRGSCAETFVVAPPAPPSYDQNSYVLLIPNCQCGD